MILGPNKFEDISIPPHHEAVRWPLYDTISVGDDMILNFFQHCLGETSQYETNMWFKGRIPVGQTFFLEKIFFTPIGIQAKLHQFSKTLLTLDFELMNKLYAVKSFLEAEEEFSPCYGIGFRFGSPPRLYIPESVFFRLKVTRRPASKNFGVKKLFCVLDGILVRPTV